MGEGVHVTPQELRDAADTIEGLGQQIDRAPMLHADEVAKALSDTLIGQQLRQLNTDSSSAKDVLRKRLREIANLLRFTADHYDGRDQLFAQRLTSIADLNSGATVGASQPGVTVPSGN